jgi:ABC-type Fe3+/spermidine/putrescine transport system ATPase subunit
LQIGGPRELYDHPANRFVADFIGVNNLIDGVVRSVAPAPGPLRVETALGELSAARDERFREGDRCVVCVRPENAVLGVGGDAENRLEGRVSFGAYLGTALRYDVELGQGILFKADVRDLRQHRPLPVGSPVTITFAAASASVVRADA